MIDDWSAIFGFDTPVLEIVLRGSVVYLALFAMLRFVLKRQAGAMSISDLLVVVLIADASQNAMADDYTSIPDGIALVATIIGWSLLIDFVGFHVPWARRLASPPPLPLVKDGTMLYRNMRRELITEEELRSHLRLQGAERFEDVKYACMEGDGRISVVMKNQKPTGDDRPAVT